VSYFKSFQQTILSIIGYIFSDMSANGKLLINRNGVHFNWGIIWNTLNLLIIVAALVFLFTSGIRGRGRDFQLEYFVFILLFWFQFRDVANELLSLSIPGNLKDIGFINWINYGLSKIIICIFQNLIRFLLVLSIMTFLGFDYHFPSILVGFYMMTVFSIYFGAFVYFVFEDSFLFQNLFRFVLLALFFMSDVIIPITVFPPGIRDYLLYNPLVHVNSSMREPITNIYYTYIDLGYAIDCLVYGFIIFLLLFIFKFYRNNFQVT